MTDAIDMFHWNATLDAIATEGIAQQNQDANNSWTWCDHCNIWHAPDLAAMEGEWER